MLNAVVAPGASEFRGGSITCEATSALLPSRSATRSRGISRALDAVFVILPLTTSESGVRAGFTVTCSPAPTASASRAPRYSETVDGQVFMTMSRAPIASSTSASMRPVSASPAMRKWRCRAAAGFSALPGPRSSTGSRRPRDGGLTARWSAGDRRADRWRRRLELSAPPAASRSLGAGGVGGDGASAGRTREGGGLSAVVIRRSFRRRRGDFGNRLPNSPAARENSARPCRISCSARRDPRRPRAPRRRPCTWFRNPGRSGSSGRSSGVAPEAVGGAVRKLAEQRDYGLDHRNVLISAFCRRAVMIADFLQFVDPRRYAGVARSLTCRPLSSLAPRRHARGDPAVQRDCGTDRDYRERARIHRRSGSSA